MGTATAGAGLRRRVIRVAARGLVVVSLVLGGATPAFAAGPGGPGGGPGGGTGAAPAGPGGGGPGGGPGGGGPGGGHGGPGGGGTSTATGNDISYPQCGSKLPASPAFGIVGLNGGLADDLNPCFGPSSSYPSYTGSELYWAVASTVGGTSQRKASLYVNTADPGDVYDGTVIADWPTSGITPYGSCETTTTPYGTVGANSDACAWQYGYNEATQDAARLTAAARAINDQKPPVAVPGTAGSYPWWLDVETTNTWQTDTSMNVADLQGMIAGLDKAGAGSVGVYSTSSQWDTITGGTGPSSGSLQRVPEWLPGAGSLSGAQANCTQASFTGGPVTVTQWFGNADDGDYAC